MIFDFRSDTVTRPTSEMLQAMVSAKCGDDVLGDDPTVERLEKQVAEMLGKESALFVTSGTMANLLAIFLHCRPGDEFLCEESSHVYIFEQGGYAQINGVCAHTLPGERGIFEPDAVTKAIRGSNIHFPDTKAVFLENTHNRGGGKLWPWETLSAVCQRAKEHHLTSHLDGARLMNAVIATGRAAQDWAKPFDTVSLCFSKGLGAPVGSILAGPADWIRSARRRRKVLGGGMRQVGVLAAAALYALENHVERLIDDHKNANQLADGIRNMPQNLIRLKYDTIETNMVFFDVVSPQIFDAATKLQQTPAQYFCHELARHHVLMHPTAPTTIRAVTHLDVDACAVQKATATIDKCCAVP